MQPKQPRRTRPSPSIELIWVLVVLVGIFIFLNTHPIRPHDFWWHIAAGRTVVQTGRIPTTATETYTAMGEPYPSYSVYWLAETTMFLIYDLGGPAATVVFHSLTVGSAYALTLWLCHRRSRSWRTAALATFFAAAMGVNDWNVRPQAMVFWLLPLFLLVQDLDDRSRNNALLVAFPTGMAVWVNCHGTFPVGLASIGLWLADHVARLLAIAPPRAPKTDAQTLLRVLGTLAISMLACLLNPRGFGILTYLQTLTTNPTVQNLVPEWMSPTFQSFSGTVFLVGLMLCATVFAISPRRPTPRQLLTFLAFGLLGLKTSRGVTWFGLALAPALAEHGGYILRSMGLVDGGRRPQTRLTRSINLALTSVILLSGIFTLPWLKAALPLPGKKAGLISAETPLMATEHLVSAAPPGPVFHDLAFGSYLVWAAQPAYPVFVDPRIELYSEAIWRDYLAISAAQSGWQDRLDRYGVNTLMLSPVSQPRLLAESRASGAWCEIYSDAIATILTRLPVP